MPRTKIYIKNANVRILSGFIGHITRYQPGKISYSDLPLEVDIVDRDDKTEHACELVEVLPFKEDIPRILLMVSEASLAPDIIDSIHSRCGTNHVNQLAFYLYAKQ
jgi:hypothetical protein